MYDLSVYDDQFYDTYGNEAKLMAPWLMPLLRDVVLFDSMIDFGCGEGHYVRWCSDNGIIAMGVEGSPSAQKRAIARVVAHDLRTPFVWGVRYDMSLSLETAEHIESEYAEVFVKSLCQTSTVVMTAAPPGQGGLQHCNEQPKEYWESLFKARGFELDWGTTVDLQAGIRQAIKDGQYCAPWLIPNLMVFRRA